MFPSMKFQNDGRPNLRWTLKRCYRLKLVNLIIF
jgi:hypothetical protein